MRILSVLCFGIVFSPSSSKAGAPAPPSPIVQRIGLSDVIVIGTVTKVESKQTQALPFRGGNPMDHTVCVVKIEEHIRGAKGLTHLRVAYITEMKWRPTWPLYAKERVILFLQDHPQETFYVMTDRAGKVNLPAMNTPAVDKMVSQIKSLATLQDNPIASLKSKDAMERLFAAALLIVQYRTVPRFEVKPDTEPLSQEESSLLCKVLLEYDWRKPMNSFELGYLTPYQLFNRLGVSKKEGFNLSRGSISQRLDASRAWLKKNMDSYRIQRFVKNQKK